MAPSLLPFVGLRMNFRSDNTAAAAPEILRALNEANVGRAAPYGADEWSTRLNEAFSNVFEHEAFVFLVSTGTAANAISLASVTPSWAGVLCHREAHIERDEGGAPEFYTGGAKLILLEGPHAKLNASAVSAALAAPDDVHRVKPAALSISQATERGTLYRPEEIRALSDAAHAKGLAVHMDGARFANAAAALNCAPADISWRAGVDLLSFGATKNGALGAEAIVVFEGARAEEIERRRKRGGHLLSKSRYAAAQFLTYLEDGLWLRLAARANALAAELGASAGANLTAPVETNQAFVKLGRDGLARFRKHGFDFLEWDPGEARFVVSWDQSEADVNALCRLLSAHA